MIIDQTRWRTALHRVRDIEKHSQVLRPRFLPRSFTYSKRSAWGTPSGLAVLPADQQHDLPGSGKVAARVRAESVLIGKFDVDAEVRLRAFYPAQALSIRYQTGGQRNGITRTVKAHEYVHPHAPDLMPTIHEQGTILDGQGAYLVEDTVTGTTPTRAQLEELIQPLTSRLHAVHQGIGVTHKHLGKIVGGMYRQRWRQFVADQNIEPRLDRVVQDLITRNALLEVSLTHGDLVNSNILVDGSNFVLVDWEFAEMKPVAFDMAKMIINVKNFEKVLQHMHTGLGGTIGTQQDHYSFREQIALAIVLTLSWHRNHLAKAKLAGRKDALARQTSKRLAAIVQLLEIG